MSKKTGTIIKLTSFFAILLIGVFGMVALGSTDKKSNKKEIKPESRKVETLQLTFQDTPLEIEGNGVIEAVKTLNIVSEVRGSAVFAYMDLKSGTYVKQDQLICKIDARQAENDAYSLRSEFMKRITSFLAYTKLDEKDMYDEWLAYFNKLDINADIPVLPEISNPREKILLSNHNILSQYYAVKNAEIILSKHIISAPFDGFITSGGVIQGSFINTGQKVVTIRNAKNIEISIPLLVEDAKWIDFDNNPVVKVFWSDYSDDWVQGVVNRQEKQLDRNSQSMNVYVNLNNKDLNPNLFPGNYVRVLIQGRIIPAVAVIPRYVIVNDNQVYYVDEGSKLGRTTVEVIAVQGDIALIGKTLPENTRLITTILQKPLVGMPIEDVSVIREQTTADDSVAAAELK